MRYWWVNQNQSYAEERAGGFLWAPKLTTNGRRQPHWDSLLEVEAGDRILHFAGQSVRAISTATAESIDMVRPAELPVALWDTDGRLIRPTYHDARMPVHREEVPVVSQFERDED